MQDSELCYRKFLQGDPNALTELIRFHQAGLTLFLYGITKNYELAQDAVQETFIKLYVKKPKFKGNSQFQTWLYKIGKNTAVDLLRRKKAMPLEVSPQPSEDPALQYLADENKRSVHRALCNLPPAYYEILWLVYFEELPVRDAAKIIGKSQNNTSVLLHRAKTALKNQLEQEDISYEIT